MPEGTWSAVLKLSSAAGHLIEDVTGAVTVFVAPDSNGHTHGLLFALDPSQTQAWPVEALVGRVWFSDTEGVKVVSPPFEVSVEAV